MRQVSKFGLFLSLFLITQTGISQSVLGKWKTIDDVTGKPKSIVEIFERGGKVHGKVIKLFPDPNEDPDPICTECDEDDPRYKKKIIGMEILSNMMKEGNEYTDGEVLDPNNGKIYSCKFWLEGKDLKFRGYIGPFFRTQTWLRAE